MRNITGDNVVPLLKEKYYKYFGHVLYHMKYCYFVDTTNVNLLKIKNVLFIFVWLSFELFTNELYQFV